MLRVKGTQRAIWDEQAALSKINFAHPDETSPYDQTEDLAGQMAELSHAPPSLDQSGADSSPRLFGEEWIPVLEIAAKDHIAALKAA